MVGHKHRMGHKKERQSLQVTPLIMASCSTVLADDMRLCRRVNVLETMKVNCSRSDAVQGQYKDMGTL